MKIGITGATGQLGRLVIEKLLASKSPESIVALVRSKGKAADLAGKGVEIREADYENPEALRSALLGIDRLLLVSGSEPGKRLRQHTNVIEAALQVGVGHLAYTSLLHADRSSLGLAEEHRQTEALIQERVPSYAILRNGWYTENYTASIPTTLEYSSLFGAAKDGRIASAAREDYAEAAAQIISGSFEANHVYELAGDQAYTLTEFATEIGRQTGREIAYQDLEEAKYKDLLIGAGLPEAIADLLADSDAGAARGDLFDASKELSRIIGRPTTPFAESIAGALAPESVA